MLTYHSIQVTRTLAGVWNNPMKQNNKSPDRSANTSKTIAYLESTFAAIIGKYATTHGSDNRVGTTLYKYQVDFSYIIDDVKRGNSYSTQKYIMDANALIDKVKSELK